ncbi:hypothetical protein DPMN_137278 [Dreissena polymorpha]|uniref:Uncharacterized protein n=1 Tax=Dreissena polymorpha TaxID=45954 RepID=A0A9D4G567_DREPO|nr:hypothetical protein DPMN_137278 [Dreissena polymorpha]
MSLGGGKRIPPRHSARLVFGVDNVIYVNYEYGETNVRDDRKLSKEFALLVN